ncbi:hypothetical protein C7M84_004841 [Penaeus vannamei]|uniref:Uncharacterized protein n=1 Tax=Penaeus vannamei TaxID=6689 RepID=A0A3R7N3U3_PENVA|nr:hypothetical protein C7M84_004841 [Penaeus vannamei]
MRNPPTAQTHFLPSVSPLAISFPFVSPHTITPCSSPSISLPSSLLTLPYSLPPPSLLPSFSPLTSFLPSPLFSPHYFHFLLFPLISTSPPPYPIHFFAPQVILSLQTPLLSPLLLPFPTPLSIPSPLFSPHYLHFSPFSMISNCPPPYPIHFFAPQVILSPLLSSFPSPLPQHPSPLPPPPSYAFPSSDILSCSLPVPIPSLPPLISLPLVPHPSIYPLPLPPRPLLSSLSILPYPHPCAFIPSPPLPPPHLHFPLQPTHKHRRTDDDVRPIAGRIPRNPDRSSPRTKRTKSKDEIQDSRLDRTPTAPEPPVKRTRDLFPYCLSGHKRPSTTKYLDTENTPRNASAHTQITTRTSRSERENGVPNPDLLTRLTPAERDQPNFIAPSSPSIIRK